jgi:hypothetical protein
MEFKFIINKWSNFYFFVQNLSNWHFSCRKKYNILWQKELGKLSSEEKKALKIFKKIRLRYGPGKTCFEKAFFTKRHPWQLLSSTLTVKEYQDIDKIFVIFQNKFEKFYRKEYPFLQRWQKLLNKTTNNKTLNKKITRVLDVLYSTNTTDKKTVNVYLLPSSPNAIGGGANIDKKCISLEISHYPIEKSNHALGIIWHEIIHLVFEKEYFFPILKKSFPNDRGALNLIKEITHRALFPRGILAKKFLRINRSKKELLHRKISPLRTKQILSLVSPYIQKNKPLDDQYVKKLFSIVSKLKGEVK